MKKTLFVFGLLLTFVLSGCSPISVRTDYDHEVNFANYQTFRWMPYPKKAKRKMVPRNSPLDKSIRQAVEHELKAQGLEMKKSGKVDALLVYHVGTRERVEIQHYGYRYDYWYRRGHMHRFKEGSIIIDVVDPEQKQLIWRGSASGVVGHPEGSPEKVDEAIAKVFEQYPPS